LILYGRYLESSADFVILISVFSGSDAAGPALGTAWGLTMHQELYVLVHGAGLTPTEALKSATSVTAKRFGWHDRGRIADGLKADLVLVEGNPLKNIDHTMNLRGVWRDGVLSTKYQL
jgi:imidazolonepropionase-like amidohydrolase